MDRPTTRTDADARITRLDLPEAFLPPSRVAAIELGLAALEAGPVLVTGDAGIGKTWMVGRWTALAATSRWIRIDLTPADGPVDLYRQLARGLGIAPASPCRLDIADALGERDADGERLSLVIDEAHNLAPEVWEEVRVLTNRLGQPDGFQHLILAGQTPLVRRFATRPLAAVAARLAAHVHLRPIEVAEAGQWLGRRHPGLDWSGSELESVHRDAGGNPARLLRQFAAIASRSPSRPSLGRSSATAGRRDPAREDQAPTAQLAARSGYAPLGDPGARPPLHVEENSIEVGWSAEDGESLSADEADTAEDGGDSDREGELAPRLEESDQAVHDHYAALQAWREWADNQDKRVNPAKSDRDLADAIDEAAAAEAGDAEAIPGDRPSIRAEGHQHFAPFGQLFSRMSQVREPGTPRS